MLEEGGGYGYLEEKESKGYGVTANPWTVPTIFLRLIYNPITSKRVNMALVIKMGVGHRN